MLFDHVDLRVSDLARVRPLYDALSAAMGFTRWDEIGRAHAEFFREIRPATTMVEVSRLIDPDMLIEIEADAVIENPR